MGKRVAPAVSVAGLCFTYLGSKGQVLTDIMFLAAPGELTWLTGPNASGKSTLLKVISGVIPAVIEGKLTGHLAVGQVGGPDRVTTECQAGHPSPWNPAVGMVPQDANVYLFRTVYDEIAFPVENSGAQLEDVPDRVTAALDLVGIAHLQERMMHTLSGGERQKVAIAAALSVHPEILLLDEPFEQLDPSAAQDVLQLLRSLAAEGAAVVIATRDASRVGPGDAHITICGGQLNVSPPPCVVGERPQLRPGSSVLVCQEVSHRFSTGGGISDVNLAVSAGEAVAVLGPNGAGKTTLMKHVIGLLRPESGSVVVNGTDIATLKVHEVARQVGILFQNPDEQIFNRTVLAEVEWGLLARGVTRPDAADRAFAVLDELGLSAMASTNPHELTASERQLVAFASVLVTNPQLIVLDEPTKALDDQAAEKLAAAVDRRLAQGAAVLLVTHDVRFADRIATRRVMLTDGQLAAIPTE